VGCEGLIGPSGHTTSPHTMASRGMANMMAGSIISIMSLSMYSFLRALMRTDKPHTNSYVVPLSQNMLIGQAIYDVTESGGGMHAALMQQSLITLLFAYTMQALHAMHNY
jgi:hypothetical protein